MDESLWQAASFVLVIDILWHNLSCMYKFAKKSYAALAVNLIIED